jgi:hypothetical protein
MPPPKRNPSLYTRVIPLDARWHNTDITDIDIWRGCLYAGIMPRTARSIEAGMIYHVLNRGNGRMRLFHNERDYDAFERVLSEGLGRYSVDMLTYCLIPSHS